MKHLLPILILLLSYSSYGAGDTVTYKYKHPNQASIIPFISYCPGGPDMLPAKHGLNGNFINYSGLGLRGQSSHKYWQAGIALEVGGTQAKAKVNKGYQDPARHAFSTQLMSDDIYCRERYMGSYIYLHGKIGFFHQHIQLFAGIMGSLSVNGGASNYSYFEYNSPSGKLLLMSAPSNGLLPGYGGQAGIAVKLAKKLYIVAQAEARKTKAYAYVLDPQRADDGFDNNSTLQYAHFYYHYWYYPVSVGVRFSR